MEQYETSSELVPPGSRLRLVGDTITTTIELPVDMHQRITAMAVRERRSGRAQVLWLIDRALDLHDKPDGPARTALPAVNSPEFEAFWTAYPRKTGKRAARTAWDRAVTRAEIAVILAGTARYRDDPNREPAYTAHPSTWLNQDRWDDEPLPPPAAPRSRVVPTRQRMAQAIEAGRRAQDRHDHGKALPR